MNMILFMKFFKYFKNYLNLRRCYNSLNENNSCQMKIFSDMGEIFHTLHFSIFEPPCKGRNEILEKKVRLFFQTEFHGDSEKKTRLCTRLLFFDQIPLLKKTPLNYQNQR